jgi:hypothetical protein
MQKNSLKNTIQISLHRPEVMMAHAFIGENRGIEKYSHVFIAGKRPLSEQPCFQPTRDCIVLRKMVVV